MKNVRISRNQLVGLLKIHNLDRFTEEEVSEEIKKVLSKYGFYEDESDSFYDVLVADGYPHTEDLTDVLGRYTPFTLKSVPHKTRGCRLHVEIDGIKEHVGWSVDEAMGKALRHWNKIGRPVSNVRFVDALRPPLKRFNASRK